MSADLFGDGRQLKGIGYAGRPGAGPAGETCGTCRWMTGTRFKKCGHPRGRRTFGAGTDILVSAPACEHWEGEAPAKHCQNGDALVCLAGSRDGVCCPDDSCDIDDGLRGGSERHD